MNRQRHQRLKPLGISGYFNNFQIEHTSHYSRINQQIQLVKHD